MTDSMREQQWRRLEAALEREKFIGPIDAAHYAGERAYDIGRTAAEREGASPDEAEARGLRAFWYAYFTDLAAEATARAAAAGDLRQHSEALPS
ncbi:MAG TPA: hypothetical protein VGS80_05685 [Ktedonobacterales bacterium]|nr:hypothetical protein [Ktedonobacterales bacterium]